MTARLAPVGATEAAALWPTVAGSHLFDTAKEYEAFRARFPWAVLVTQRGEAALLARWRAHLGILAVRGLWCARREVGPLLGEVSEVAAERGFDRVLSPVVTEQEAAPYERAGLERVQTLVSWRAPGAPRPDRPATPEGTVLRTPSADELDALLALDAACFDEFWRSDAEHMLRHSAAGRIGVAARGGELLGYTQCTVRGASATLGRLAVAPGGRGAGLGAALLADAMAWAAGRGASHVSLCMQERNEQAHRLYSRAGFRELPGRLVLLMTKTGR